MRRPYFVGHIIHCGPVDTGPCPRKLAVTYERSLVIAYEGTGVRRDGRSSVGHYVPSLAGLRVPLLAVLHASNIHCHLRIDKESDRSVEFGVRLHEPHVSCRREYGNPGSGYRGSKMIASARQ